LSDNDSVSPEKIFAVSILTGGRRVIIAGTRIVKARRINRAVRDLPVCRRSGHYQLCISFSVIHKANKPLRTRSRAAGRQGFVISRFFSFSGYTDGKDYCLLLISNPSKGKPEK